MIPCALLPVLFLAALVGKCARRFTGRLARGLALAAARLLRLLLEAALDNRFYVLHLV